MPPALPDISLFGCCLTLAAFIMITSVAGFPNCPGDRYFDHGTDKCENCRDICDNAQIQRTVETCLQLCPAYARKIGLLIETPTDTKPQDPRSQPSSHLSTGAQIGIGVAAAVTAVCLVALAVIKRGSIRQQLKRAQSPHIPVFRKPERVPSVPNVGTGEPEVGTQERLLRTVHDQETSDWRDVKHELAVHGDIRGSGLSEEVEPKRVHTQGASRAAPAMATSLPLAFGRSSCSSLASRTFIVSFAALL